MIDEHVDWDSRRCQLSPRERITALILNVLSRPRPLYRVREAFEDTDVELILGRGVPLDDLNDDGLGRAVDRTHCADARRMFSLVAAQAPVRDQVDRQCLHRDPTTRSLPPREEPHASRFAAGDLGLRGRW